MKPETPITQLDDGALIDRASAAPSALGVLDVELTEALVSEV